MGFMDKLKGGAGSLKARMAPGAGKAANYARGAGAAGLAGASAVGGAAVGAAGSIAGGAVGVAKSIPWKLLIKIFIVILVIVLIAFYFMSVGGVQFSAGGSAQMSKNIGKIFDSTAIRQFINTVKNPFAVGAEGAGVEPDKTTNAPPPNQAFNIEVRKFVDTVMFDQKSLSFFVTINNIGSSSIKKAIVQIDGDKPYEGCIKFDSLPGICNTPMTAALNAEGPPYHCEITDIPAFGTKQFVLSGGYVDGNCVYTALNDEIKPGVATPVYLSMTAFTYYPTASRLAVERIRTDYGSLLFQNELLKPQQTGAIYKAGSAMVINLDIGNQPILDSTTQAGLLVDWTNQGSGKMMANTMPFIFIITPKQFGECIMQGFESGIFVATGDETCSIKKCLASCNQNTECLKLCNLNLQVCENVMNPRGDSVCPGAGVVFNPATTPPSYEISDKCIICGAALNASWCNKQSDVWTYIHEYIPDMANVFDWVCTKKLNDPNYSVCATNVFSPESEFQLFSCPLSMYPIGATENRHTDYITVISVYPYSSESNSVKIQATCVAGTCPGE